MHILIVPSFFFTNSTGAPYGDFDGWMNLASINSCSCFFNSSVSAALMRKVGRDGGVEPGVSSMRWSMSRVGGRPAGSWSGKTSRYSSTRRRAATTSGDVGEVEEVCRVWQDRERGSVAEVTYAMNVSSTC